MSTPIRQEVSPEDPKFYAPPRWRRGEVVAPSIQPSLRSAEFSGPQAYPDWTSQHGDEVLADERGRSTYKRAVDALPKARQPSARRGTANMRVTALAIAAGVVLWTAVCVAFALGDSMSSISSNCEMDCRWQRVRRHQRSLRLRP